MEEIKKKIFELLEKPLEKEECHIVEIILSKYKNRSTLRLFVYAKDKSSLEEIARISRIVGDTIDGSELFESGYTLEVSSPGLDRPLVTLDDFKYRLGEKVRIFFKDAKKKETAEIIAAENDKIEFEVETGRVWYDLAAIEKAKIVF